MRNIISFHAPITVTITTPSVEDILPGHLPAPSWLTLEAWELTTSDDPISKIAGLGLIARLWVPETRELRMKIMRSEFPDPSARIINWLRTVPRVDLEALAMEAIYSVDALGDEVEPLIHISDPKDAIDEAQRFVQKRDVLESAACLLGGSRPAAALRTALKFLDNKVVSRMDQLPAPKQFLDTPKNRAVFLREPLNWWGYGEE